MRQQRVMVLFWLCWLAIASLAFTSGQAAAPGLEIIPEAISLRAGEETHIVIVAHNDGPAVVKNVRLSWLPARSLTLQATPEGAMDISPGGDGLWDMIVQLAPDATQSQTIHFRMDYEYQPEGEQETVQGARFVPLEVNLRTQPAVEQVAQIQVQSSLKTLDEYHPGLIYLTATNLSAQPLQLGGLQIKSPDFVTIEVLEAFPAQLEAYGSHVSALKISVSASQPGEHLLFFEMPLSRQAEGQVERFILQASYPVGVSVFGESQILGALAAVPSFLVLPGFLFMVMLRFSTRGWVKYKATDEEFWLFAVSFSLLMALILYPWTTRWMRQPRSYLGYYGFQDIVWVWFGSIALALFVAGLYWLVVFAKQKQAESFAFSKKDTPLEVLEKLERRKGGNWLLPVARLKDSQNQKHAYLLESVGDQKDAYWACSAIQYSLLPVDDDHLKGLQDQWSDAINTADISLPQLLSVLKQTQSVNPPPIRLAWAAEPFSGVQKVETARLDRSSQSGLPPNRPVIEKMTE